MPQEIVALVFNGRSKPEPSIAQIVGAQDQIRALGWVLDIEQLVDVPIGQHLPTEHVVVAECESFEIVRRFPQIGRHHRPVEYWEPADVQEVVVAGRQQFVVDGDLLVRGSMSGMPVSGLMRGSLRVA